MKTLEITNFKKILSLQLPDQKVPYSQSINLSVEHGEIYGFLGPTGPAKLPPLSVSWIAFPG